MIEIFTTGGTIDKVYFDALSEYQIGPAAVPDMLSENNVHAPHRVTQLLRKDSLDMTDADRAVIRMAVTKSDAAQILITHGTDTMVETARALSGVKGKTIVLTGAMRPFSLYASDGEFNLGGAIVAAQLLAPGVWGVMNGRMFPAETLNKNVEQGRFDA
ncbi:MAG: asparaginase [Sphingomonadales bacterium]|nr:asparaginase [Sphingomonadales bacterium]